MSKVGSIGWRELMSPKPEQSERFYRELFGWKIRAVPMGPSGTYRLCDVGPKEIAGIMASNDASVPPHWVSYVTVADVDAAAKAATSAGGKLAHPPTDIPNVGRFAVIVDPMGAVTVAFKSANPEPASSDRPSPGEFCWETLMTSDAAKSLAFYKQVYGWTTKPMDGGDTQLFYAGDRMLADIEKTPPGVPPSWLTYVVVPKLADAREKAKKLGGKILMEEVEVPKMGVFSVIQDDVGAAIGLFEPRM